MKTYKNLYEPAGIKVRKTIILVKSNLKTFDSWIILPRITVYVNIFLIYCTSKNPNRATHFFIWKYHRPLFCKAHYANIITGLRYEPIMEARLNIIQSKTQFCKNSNIVCYSAKPFNYLVRNKDDGRL